MSRAVTPTFQMRSTIHALFFAAPLLLLPNMASALSTLTVGAAANCSFSKIQDAINSLGSGDIGIVYIAPGEYDEVLDVNNQALNLLAPTPATNCTGGTGDVTINGSGHQRAVMNINGASQIYLSGLTFTGGGGDSSQHGGGIYYSGHGTLELSSVIVAGNTSGYGGGISASSNGGHVDLRIDAGVIIENNHALTDGGGIHIDGDTHLFVLYPETTIFLNHADRNGGGIDITGPASADIGGGGYAGGLFAVIEQNTAFNDGGGISALAPDADNEPPVINLYTTDPDHSVAIHGNTAHNVGGGIYLQPFNSEEFFNSNNSSAGLCAYDFRISGNTAKDGAAIYADENLDSLGHEPYASDVYLNVTGISPSGDFSCNGPNPGFALACADGEACNEISDNHSEDAMGNPTDGSVILFKGSDTLVAERVGVRRNEGGHILRFLAEGSPNGNYASLEDFLVTDNQVTGELFYMASADGKPNLIHILDSTVAHDTIAGSSVAFVDSSSFIELRRDVIAENKPTIFGQGQQSAAAAYVLSTDISTLPSSATVFTGDPEFIAVAAGDYHLQATSPAIDFAPTNASGIAVDLDGKPRAVDLPGLGGDSTKPRDLGAYERQFVCGADTLFCNGFDG